MAGPRHHRACERDVSPGRVLPDAGLIELATKAPASPAELGDGPTSRATRRYQRQWLAAIRRAQALPDAELPLLTLRADGPPPARAWADRDPVAAARLAQARAALADLALAHQVPVENLLSPDALRRVLWTPPEPADADAVAAALRELGARPWQVDLVAPIIVAAVASHPGVED